MTTDAKPTAPLSVTQTDLLYRMARHIRNTDSIPALKWGIEGGELLRELRDLDPNRYDREVKGTNDAKSYRASE